MSKRTSRGTRAPLWDQCAALLRYASRGALPLLAAFLLLAVGRAPVATAAEPNRAGLAILFEDGTLVTRCIEFEEDTIAGSELLARSGLEIIIDSTHGGGITVCKIEGTGCDFPVDACFCQCMGNGTCGYWNYYYREPGSAEWVYSPLGALLVKSAPGSLQAWVWGDGRVPPDQALTFEAVCDASIASAPTLLPEEGEAAPNSTVSLEPPADVPLTSAPASPQGSEATPAAALSPIEGRALTPTPISSSAASGEGWRSYWPFGLLLLALAAVAVYLRAGRRL